MLLAVGASQRPAANQSAAAGDEQGMQSAEIH